MFFSSYQMGGVQTLNWVEVSEKDQLIYGATLGFAFLIAVEVFDGYFEKWGFSWTDVLANVVGLELYVGQELLWSEQRMILKFSFHQTQYASQHPDKLGNSFLEQVLKDYNGQTYWLNINLHSFFKESKIRKWLDLLVKYGAEGVLDGLKDVDNQLLANNGRSGQFYVSFDLNLSKIETKSKLSKSILDIFNVISMPFPTVQFSKNGSVFHLFYY